MLVGYGRAGNERDVAGKSGHERRTTVYTDGACLGNPGPGGWAWAVPGGRWRSGAGRRTTNQRMEIIGRAGRSPRPAKARSRW